MWNPRTLYPGRFNTCDFTLYYLEGPLLSLPRVLLYGHVCAAMPMRVTTQHACECVFMCACVYMPMSACAHVFECTSMHL